MYWDASDGDWTAQLILLLDEFLDIPGSQSCLDVLPVLQSPGCSIADILDECERVLPALG